MRAASIVVTHPRFQYDSQMRLGQRNKPVQALSANRPMTRSQIAFAIGHCGGVFSTRRPRCPTDSSRSHEKMLWQSWIRYSYRFSWPDRLSQLLARPARARLGCHVAVNQATASMFDHYEHIQQSERAGHCNEKVAGDHDVRVVLPESRPALIASRTTRRLSR